MTKCNFVLQELSLLISVVTLNFCRLIMGKMKIGIDCCFIAYVLIKVFCVPNFEQADGAYCFQVVLSSIHASVCSSRTVHARALKFHIWIPDGKIADTHFFLVRVISLSGVMPL